MARYIDAYFAQQIADAELSSSAELNSSDKGTVQWILAHTPTADVQEVRHGRWMYCGKSRGRDHMWQCSECLRTEFTKHKSDIRDYPYCHCGAKMEGGID